MIHRRDWLRSEASWGVDGGDRETSSNAVDGSTEKMAANSIAASRPAPMNTRATGGDSGKARLLYIEDDPGQASLVQRTLERWGYHVDLARDGGEGLALFARAQHDVLIVDQNLPRLSGLEVIRTLSETTGLPPTVMLTGARSEDVAVKAMKLGVSDYLTKDAGGLYLGLLPSVIHKTIQQRRLLDDRVKAEAALEQEHGQLLSVFESLEEAIYVSDLDTHEILFVNAAMRKLRSGRPLVGETCYRVLHDHDAPCTFCTNATIRENPGQVHRWEHHDASSDRDFALTDRLIRWPDGRMVRFEYALDITEHKRAEERLEHLAYHDILTGLPNRQLLCDRLENAVALAERHGHHLGLIFLDIDNFKAVNDSYGHAAGDSLLRRVAERLHRTVRRSDTVGRLGGDEFLILLPELAHTDDVALIAEKIVRVMKLPFLVDGNAIVGTCSVGTVVYPLDGATPDELLGKADEALYKAKALGGSRHQAYVSTSDHRAGPTASLKESLAQALEAEQLVVHYQPQMSLRTGEIIGAEALIRWQHPERGLLAPHDFLPFAEGIGLGPSIDCWVLRKACEQANVWKDEGWPWMRISVNLSLFQLRSPDFSRKIRAILKDTGLDPARLDLEVTESMAAEDIGAYATQLESLRFLGVRLALDDFGTGNTSISHLHRLPIGCVKIDQALIQAATGGPRPRAVVSAITAFAHMLGLVVVAEGVETDEQVEWARRSGCDIGQGFALARPMPADEFDRYLATKSPRGGKPGLWPNVEAIGRKAA
jgi:diguanylate cyclase (GGDEF)-like protein